MHCAGDVLANIQLARLASGRYVAELIQKVGRSSLKHANCQWEDVAGQLCNTCQSSLEMFNTIVTHSR